MRRRTWIVAAVVLVAAAAVFVSRGTSDPRGGARAAIPTEPADTRSGGLEAPPSPLAGAPLSKPLVPDVAGMPTRASSVSVHGVVSSSVGVPAPGAAVEVVVRRGPSTVERVAASAGADGEYRADLPGAAALSDDARSVCEIGVTARIAGREMGRESLSRATKREGDLRLDVMLGEAMLQSIIGRVLGVEGAPVVDLTVHVCANGVPVGYPQTGADGQFACAIAKPGVYAVEALDPEEGFARLESVNVAAGATFDAGDLRLHPASVIDGRVELPDATIPPPMEVFAVPADSAGLRSGGCRPTGAAVWTAIDGRFAFRTLSPGRYRLGPNRASVIAGTEDETVVETDAHGVVLVVRLRFVVVHVVDASGKPFEGATCSYEEDRDHPEEGAVGAGDFSHVGSTHVFPFKHPVKLRVSVSAGAMAADVVRVEVPEDRWLVEATAVLRPKSAYGTIRLELVGSDGQPIPKFRAEAHMLFDGRPGIFTSAWTSKDGLGSKPVRPGRYTVAIAPGIEGDVPSDPGGPCFGLLRTDVDVPSGGEIVARVRAQAGGWLRVKLVMPDDKPGVRCGYSIRREGHESDPPVWAMWSDPDQQGHWHLLESGGPQLFAQPFEPGRYVLTTGPDRARETTTPFEIRAGATTDVEMRFKPAEKDPPK